MNELTITQRTKRNRWATDLVVKFLPTLRPPQTSKYATRRPI